MWVFGLAVWSWIVIILIGLVIYEFGWIVGIILFLLICYKLSRIANTITINIRHDDP